jgi:hypothetical protein
MIRELIEMSSEVRNISQEGLIFTVFDKKISISGINWEITRVSLDQPVAALWTDDPPPTDITSRPPSRCCGSSLVQQKNESNSY